MKLRACPLNQHHAFRQPKPLEHRTIPHPREHGIYRNIVVDPEDDDYQPASQPQKVMIGGQMTAR